MSSPPGYRYSTKEISYVLRRPRRNAAARPRRREGSLLGAFYKFIVEHQIGLAITLLLPLLIAHVLFPWTRGHTRKYFELSHHHAATQTYGPGWDDLPFVFFWLVIFTGMRSAVMDYVLKPLALRGGIHRKKAMQRFSEQGWLVIYYTLSFGVGMRLWMSSKYWLNLRELWTDFPDTEMSALMKRYYLIQFAFWLQQIVVINIEKRRKDYWQMLTHHFITCALLVSSYAFYMTRVGNVILCLMDVADIVLSSAKVLRYLAYQTACDVAFGIFIATWFISRHVFYTMVVWSVWADLPVYLHLGCYSASTGEKLEHETGSELSHYMQPFSQSGDVVCFDKYVHWQFLGLLVSLKCLLLAWFAMIFNVAWRVLKGQGAADSRSDDESEEEVNGSANGRGRQMKRG
ncbi:longevity assurance proteins LAG1/LAC1 [Corynespora cassiicola Philippines]|uniref:Longevity assurance proteins LAG1/LAC1 n=1 Tax=Corynespora cassiicola Philippines TaxID=1448308 RepID=A0A2T2NLS6_CORCC|nr:longevity assurance proteins LAG1/LAC1 [Corynespora cassiicola Philippines]